MSQQSQQGKSPSQDKTRQDKSLTVKDDDCLVCLRQRLEVIDHATDLLIHECDGCGHTIQDNAIQAAAAAAAAQKSQQQLKTQTTRQDQGKARQRQGWSGKETPLLPHFHFKCVQRSFYQDRLGTNIWKALKNAVAFP